MSANALGSIGTTPGGYIFSYQRLIERAPSGPTVEPFQVSCSTPQALWIQLEDAMKERMKIAVLRKRGVIKS